MMRALRRPLAVGNIFRMRWQSSRLRLRIILCLRSGHAFTIRTVTYRISSSVRRRRCARAFRDSATQTEKLTVFFIAFHSLIPSSTHCSRPDIPVETPRSNRAMTIISAACTRFLRIQQMSRASSSVNSC